MLILDKATKKEGKETIYLQPHITEKDLPCWYELGWDAQNHALVLKVHKRMLPAFQARLWADLGRENGTIRYLLRSLDAKRFVLGDLEEGFGFGWLFKRGDHDREFATWRLFLPDIGRKRYGKQLEQDVDIYKNLNANLMAVLELLMFPEPELPGCGQQLLTVMTNIRPNVAGGYSIFGEVSRDMSRHLDQLGQHELTECTQAMLDAARFMAEPDFDKNDFPAYLVPDGFVIDCPGDACGLNPAGSRFSRQEEGYRFGSHNVDRPFQQLVLLVGLAAFWEQMKNEMRKPLP